MLARGEAGAGPVYLWEKLWARSEVCHTIKAGVLWPGARENAHSAPQKRRRKGSRLCRLLGNHPTQALSALMDLEP